MKGTNSTFCREYFYAELVKCRLGPNWSHATVRTPPPMHQINVPALPHLKMKVSLKMGLRFLRCTLVWNFFFRSGSRYTFT